MYEQRKLRGGHGFAPCSLCSKNMQVTSTSAEVMTCLACRQERLARRRAKPKPQGPWLKDCSLPDCRKPYLADKMSRRFCSTECFLASHRAQERVRDAERRRRRREEIPVQALLYRGDEEANALIQGPPQSTHQVHLRTGDGHALHHPAGTYIVRCPLCGWLTDGMPDVEATHVWACHNCYTKIVLLDAPAQTPDPYRRMPSD